MHRGNPQQSRDSKQQPCSQTLTLVEKQNDLREDLQEVHVLVAVLLDAVHQQQRRLGGRGEHAEQIHVLSQVLDRLVGDQILLLAPLVRRHHRIPDDHDHLVLGQPILGHRLLDQRDDVLRGRLLNDQRLNLALQFLLDDRALAGLLQLEQRTEALLGERALDVLEALLVRRQERDDSIIDAALLQGGPHRIRVLLGEPGLEHIDEELQRDAIFDGRLLDGGHEDGSRDLADRDEDRNETGQLLADLRREALQEQQQLLDLVIQDLLQVQVATNQLVDNLREVLDVG